MSRAARLPIAIAATIMVVACGSSRPTAPPVAGPPPYKVMIIQAERLPVERTLEGTIEAVSQSTISAQTAGRVVEVRYDVNDFVPAGAVVLRLRATEQRAGVSQAQAAQDEAKARDAEASARHGRIAGMYARKVVSKAMLDEAVANRDAAASRLEAARAALLSASEGLAYTEVRAPYAEVVTQRHVEVGEAVVPGKPLFTGLSLQFLRVAVDIPQRLLESIRSNRQAVVHVDGRRIPAAKLTIFPAATPQSGTFRARVALPENSADLYPGMFVKVGFVVGEAERLMVPAASVVRRSEMTGVYVHGKAGRTLLRQVRLGPLVGDRYEVAAGLAAGEQVAVDPLEAMQHITVSPAP